MREREYQVVRYNEHGVVDTATFLGFPNDMAAAEHARALFHPGQIEVWSGHRCICTVAPAVERRGTLRRSSDIVIG